MSEYRQANTREERIDLQASDDGDPDDEVYVSARTNRNARAYHVDPDCNSLPNEIPYRVISRQAAQRRWLGPCRICVLDEPHATGVAPDDGEEDTEPTLGQLARRSDFDPDELEVSSS